MSASLPCNGGIIAPPKIIIIKNAEPWEVYLPKPAILNVKIHGHIIEQNNPPDKNANNAKFPVVNKPISIPNIPRTLNIFSVLTGLSLAKKKPAICTATQISNNSISTDQSPINLSSQMYYVEVTDGACKSLDSVYVVVGTVPYDAISQNGDGLNDGAIFVDGLSVAVGQGVAFAFDDAMNACWYKSIPSVSFYSPRVKLLRNFSVTKTLFL